ncbi:DUF3899 domain-containing protein [Ornithinibacillus californiensis]|uniref:DUF3899 domain-containing protein n=1 Tax=Ornithinibacillus californiensis TaxID=161536 RepID=UPI0009FBDAFF|nr:DUF3899 domain-containing protein [Ornithinibacillus californiensis]
MTNKRYWILLFCNIILTLFLFFTTSEQYNLVNYVNSLFYLTLGYLTLTLFLYTVKGGFYDGVTFSFRRFRSVMFRRDYLDEWKELPLPSEKTNERFYHLIRFQAIALVLIFLFILLIYYWI